MSIICMFFFAFCLGKHRRLTDKTMWHAIVDHARDALTARLISEEGHHPPTGPMLLDSSVVRSAITVLLNGADWANVVEERNARGLCGFPRQGCRPLCVPCGNVLRAHAGIAASADASSAVRTSIRVRYGDVRARRSSSTYKDDDEAGSGEEDEVRDVLFCSTSCKSLNDVVLSALCAAGQQANHEPPNDAEVVEVVLALFPQLANGAMRAAMFSAGPSSSSGPPLTVKERTGGSVAPRGEGDVRVTPSLAAALTASQARVPCLLSSAAFVWGEPEDDPDGGIRGVLASPPSSLVQQCVAIIVRIATESTRLAIHSFASGDGMIDHLRGAIALHNDPPHPILRESITDAARLLTIDHRVLVKARRALDVTLSAGRDLSCSSRSGSAALCRADVLLLTGLVLLHVAGMCDKEVNGALVAADVEVGELLESLLVSRSELNFLVSLFGVG